MATENPRVWFKSISLGNVRSFGTQQTINFTDRDGNAARWNMILGDNGTGKTTVLKGLCLSTGSYWSDSAAIAFQRVMGSISMQCVLEEDGQEKKISPFLVNFNARRSGQYVSGANWSVILEVGSHLLLFAYGATRRISDSAISREMTREMNSYTSNLFDENESLINAEEWIIQADYLRLKDNSYEKKFNIVYDVIQKLFREEAPGGILIDTSLGAPQVRLHTYYGAVRFQKLSLGYKTLIAWMVDFAKGLVDQYPDSENPLAEPAVCLVDEIDLHLHPKFQRTIIQFLTDTFPNTQFIVTAHSPLIVQSAENANIILLKREGDETHVADGIDVHSWRIDQILSSDLFGGIGGRSPQIEEKMARRRALLRKDDRTPDEILELDTLEKELNELPVMETREALKAIDIISKAVIAEG